MTREKTYRHSPAKIFFALAFLVSLSFFPGAGGSSAAAQFQGRTKTELVVSSKVKTPGWQRSFHKKVKLKTITESPALRNYESYLLFAYNKLIKARFKILSPNKPLIKFPDTFFRVKTIPETSEENNFIFFAG